jgi:hypothetical protein
LEIQKNIATKPHHLHYRYNLSTSNKEGETVGDMGVETEDLDLK